MTIRTYKVAALVLASSMMLSATPASAALMFYDFSIDGFDDGGILSGSFSGEDLDGDGYIADAIGNQGELRNLSVSFTGNSLINPFSFQTADFTPDSALSYALGTTSFGPNPNAPRTGFIFQTADYFMGGGTALVSSCGVSTCFLVGDNATATLSNSVGSITHTGGAPEPATWAMMILGFGIAGAALRRQRDASAPSKTSLA